ncbi:MULTISPECIES: alpha/beta hydrolase fold domain-containing protein [unclassified Shinella]|uniref:alpha/beta hydrolase n=1 Tax=unclassified Shinella TaxID=2643062 RepID=UPI00225D91E6|nr:MULTISPECIES: alpha/beta hydrolase fold domain-containing protein [unclassified Shinella]MCO5140694.1 alpha/beta hydrolase fold domain-containing protein [Shinella sp.]MDC7256616.1 alpha/beta hydrolase fold domain-containing protein [Shinella sp. YE25]CAI0339493.1 Esterase [Rhizobiaceae bacterium]CAK7257891.1 arylformamidase [Shinella sp. WSC3-e]
MFGYRITDWDDAYENGGNIPGGTRWPAAWVEPAQQMRTALAAEGRARLDLAYGEGERNRLDLFLPEGAPRGLVVYVHGGFWLRLDKSFWSHLAAGALAHGHAVAMPSYTLCPAIRIGGIVREIAAAIETAAGLVAGELRLIGHSAGGQLVSRMVSEPSPLSAETLARIRHVLSLSGLHDLRPLMHTAMNERLHIDEAEAIAESPALLRPVEGTRLTCWAGAMERAEFLRQNALLTNIWTGLGAATSTVVEPNRHHFDIVDGLADPEHPLTRTLLSP